MFSAESGKVPHFVFLFPFPSDILGGRGRGDVCLFDRADLTHIAFSLQESQLLLFCLSETEYDHFVFFSHILAARK